MYREIAWKKYEETGSETIERFSADYMRFLDGGKTERECVDEAEEAAKSAGFKNLADWKNRKMKAGDRVYCRWMNKCFVAFILGEKPIESGMNILGAHIDSPRIDIKQNPLFEDNHLAYLDTHYYGGIKKYQWVAMPLALHGVVVRKNGKAVPVSIGENEGDPVLYITDLLPHLAQQQMEKTASKLIDGEDLNILIASKPAPKKKKDEVVSAVKKILKDSYGIEEEDFVSAELEIVPAGKSREAGLDRSMIAGYGHDDRVCAYPSLRALTDFEGIPEYTVCAVLTDKEEIGSVGATGMGSHYFENILAELLDAAGCYSELTLRRALRNSRMLSSDVSAAFDPAYKSVFESKNAAFIGMGVCFNKYTGSRGKSGASDANAEFVAQVRKLMDEANVAYHTSEIGKVDAGGGGTIAYLCAKYGMNVLDCGVPVLSMHAPWEIISKVDLYEAYLCYCAFIRNAAPQD